MRHLNYYIFLSLFLFSCSHTPDKPDYSVIPKPVSLEEGSGYFIYNNRVSIDLADGINETILERYKEDLGIIDSGSGSLKLTLDSTIQSREGYQIVVSQNNIEVSAAGEAGLFYALQTIKQLVMSNSIGVDKRIPCVSVKDEPRFSYRGMHLDVARHMFPVEFIKKYIDLMAFHKFNTFHWHLTEDQGWRLEIKQYPKLQSIAAFRNETLNGHYSDKPRTFDGKQYGGFYSHEDVKEIVQYAAQRHIEVIPEIEMPGHSLAALSAYPELACTPGPFEAATSWGVFEDVYCPKEETFEFLENVLDEVIELFPSKYIHIGGDECPKTRWKESSFCQELIKKEGLKDEHELQSYFIQRIERYLNAKGKQIIGWDEILEGGLAPNATVMSWRGTQGGIAAAKEKHKVIMSPTTHCYFDYYQSKSPNEPLAIGGFLPIEKVYSFEPVPEELTEEEAGYILGAQCNLWTEYIPTSEQAEYMVYPRASALSEVNWSSKANKNYPDFLNRLGVHINRLKSLNVNVADHYFDAEINAEYNPEGSYKIELLGNVTGQKIYYTQDGSEPNDHDLLYEEAIVTNEAINIKAASYNESSKSYGRIQTFEFNPHLATGSQLSSDTDASERYPGHAGLYTLIDGVRGGESFNAEHWLGFDGVDFIGIIDFKEETTVSNIVVGSLESKGAWINRPSFIIITELKDSGERVILSQMSVEELALQDPRNIELSFTPTKLKTLEVTIKNHGLIKDGEPGGGHKGWLFIDEIIVK